jgi:hypothetical protein
MPRRCFKVQLREVNRINCWITRKFVGQIKEICMILRKIVKLRGKLWGKLFNLEGVVEDV